MLPRKTLANAIRALAIDAVETAHSGHPGMPMGMADIAEVLWRDFLSHNPSNPLWFNRDRFVLSNGHGCMLLYAALHLSGYDLSIDDLKKFRQYHSKTPGHPEYGFTPGVEATAGPLGQGLAMAVGMAIAEKHLAAEYNQKNLVLVDHYTYVFAGDGCLMEGISHEACSLAGTLGLGKLILFYDDNGISIDGDISGWFTDNTVERFKAYHWQVISGVDGHDAAAIKKAIETARADLMHPTIICCKTKIGYGSPNLEGSEKTHGSPLGESEALATKKKLGWDYPSFFIPEEIYAQWDAVDEGARREAYWNQAFAKYETVYPAKAAEFLRRMMGALPENWQSYTNRYIEKVRHEEKALATRKMSQACIEAYSEILPEFMGGSADLTESNNTKAKSMSIFSAENASGNYIHYGVREFGMSAILNGLALHGGVIPFGGTFLVFSDYARNAVRMSAIMQQKVIYVYSHDSIGLGEDGPTHQPIEHIAMLRMTPHFEVWRPCDFVETAVAWQQAIGHSGPSAILLTRQNVPQQAHTSEKINEVARGGYILFEPENQDLKIAAIIIATGSEVQLAVTAAKALMKENIFVRVVSMPCCDRFKKQDADYREMVLPSPITARLAIEAGVPDYWYQFVGSDGAIMGINTFGASAPEKDIWQAYGFTVENVKKQLLSLLETQTHDN
ncbi:MAG: transketolase [Gammaproteobacteria bacterium CG_4_10_14_0_8_um_filter_38_16]|nr:MAG: transketolase [Gammaproteobacteria bacterium CG_4_10_14_0_8_um_filter_38_16]PJA03851.1 MAG: transketolase [Gammaproteobacteria bacterium CG_4_10_14_0_2_um_filter_38_22]PJB10824.1 MAG: transketolase [Gammaproteobacteria bacterium CG_4_9_14_3_um_filter_38_9]